MKWSSTWYFLECPQVRFERLPAFQAGHAGSIPVARSSARYLVDVPFSALARGALLRFVP